MYNMQNINQNLRAGTKVKVAEYRNNVKFWLNTIVVSDNGRTITVVNPVDYHEQFGESPSSTHIRVSRKNIMRRW